MLELKTARLQPSKTTTPKATLTAKSLWLTAHASTQTSSRQSRLETLSAWCIFLKSQWTITTLPNPRITRQDSKIWRKSQPSLTASWSSWMRRIETRHRRHQVCHRCEHSSLQPQRLQKRKFRLSVWSRTHYTIDCQALLIALKIILC